MEASQAPSLCPLGFVLTKPKHNRNSHSNKLHLKSTGQFITRKFFFPSLLHVFSRPGGTCQGVLVDNLWELGLKLHTRWVSGLELRASGLPSSTSPTCRAHGCQAGLKCPYSQGQDFWSITLAKSWHHRHMLLLLVYGMQGLDKGCRVRQAFYQGHYTASLLHLY